jgi:hypothetical protein
MLQCALQNDIELLNSYLREIRATSRSMLSGETVAAYCENHREHTDALRGQDARLHCACSRGLYHLQGCQRNGSAESFTVPEESAAKQEAIRESVA